MKKNRIRCISVVLSIIALVCIPSGCGKNDRSKAENTDTITVTATADEVTEWSTVGNNDQLLLEEKNYSTVKLDSSFDWESLYYEHLRWLDRNKYSGCALIYVNDDDVPELYLQKAKEQKVCLYYISEDGLSVHTDTALESSTGIGNSKGFWYLEKQCKVLIMDESSGQYTETNDSTTATVVHNELHRDADLWYFTGNSWEIPYSFGRYIVDGKIFDTDITDDGSYDYYDGENDIPVYNIFDAIKEYFDVEKAKTPELISIDSMVDRLKGERKNPDIKADDYNGDPHYLVSTYKELSKGTDDIDYSTNKPITIYYRIPQIELEGGDVPSINQEILEKFSKDTDKLDTSNSSDSDGEDFRTEFKKVDYEVYGQNGVLSLVIECNGFGGTSSPDDKYVYTIEIASGKRISNLCLLNSYGVDCGKAATVFDNQVKEGYDAIKNDPTHPINDPDSGFDESTYEYLYDSTIDSFSPVGNNNQMYFDDEGNLNILYLYKWVAGSPFYEETMTINISDLK